MPELPEVETMCRGIAAVRGCRIRSVERPRCRLRPIEITPTMAQWTRRAVGQRIVGVSRTGKRVVIELASGDRIVLEPRMTGLVLLAEPPDAGHLRLRFQLEGRGPSELLFWDRRGLGKARLLTGAEFDTLYGLDRLGPDALAITAEQLRQRLAASRRAVKVALLDQKCVAGIGNLYASEILHLAGIHPERSCRRLKPRDFERIHAATRQVLLTAIQHEGSTLSDGTYRNALNQTGGYQNHHRVYDKAGSTCGSCGVGSIRRIVQAQRSTYFCPTCQRTTVVGRTFPLTVASKAD